MAELLRYDHYKVLGIARDATLPEVKQAYRRCVKYCHPDRNPSPKAATVFHVVHEAYCVLSDTDQRARYDERLRFYREAQDQAAERPPTHRSTEVPRYRSHHDPPVPRFAYVGLHLTGLLFGFTLIISLIMAIHIGYVPFWAMIFSLPGVLAIPASYAGLRD